MRTLTRYIGRDVLFSTLLIFVALIGLFLFFDLINEMRDVGKGGYTLVSAVLFVALRSIGRHFGAGCSSRCTSRRASTSCSRSRR